MNVTCPCGGRVVERNHHVKTQEGAIEYGLETYPVEVEVSQCKACGRAETKFYIADGTEIKRGKK